MADVPSELDKMNDVEVDIEKTLGESYQNKRAANINAMNDLKATFHEAVFFWNKLTNGVYTFTVPENVTTLVVTGVGGGGGGSGGGGGLFGVGGSGGEVFTASVRVNPSQVLNLNVGAGGLAGGIVYTNFNEHNGGDGGNTTFHSLTFKGGIGQKGVPLDDVAMVTPVSQGGFAGDGGAWGDGGGFFLNTEAGESTIYASGGAGSGIGSQGGTGGGASYGAGGAGSTVASPQGQAGVFGGGGGGGTFNGLGGNGGDGIIIVRW